MIEDPKLMADLKAHAQQLKGDHAERDAMFEKYDEMYLLDWKEKANRKLKHAQVTASPDFRNQVQAMVRLMIATDPQINVKKNKKSEGVNIEGVEEFLNAVLYQSGRLAGEPVHYPLITAGILYDEMHAAITATADMVERAKKSADEASDPTARAYLKAAVERWEEIAEATAFMVEPWNPIGGYPEFGYGGLDAYYRVVEVTAGEVADRFGQLPDKAKTRKRSDKVNLHTFYDPVYTAVWIDQGDLLLKPHGLPRVPVIAQILNGSHMFEDVEDKRQPIGYTLLKSNLWNAQNLSLTAIFTAVLNYAWNPTKVYTPQIEGSRIDIDNDDDVINLHPGDRLDWVQSKGLIDPSMREASAQAKQLGYESGIFPQAWGAPGAGGNTFSEYSMVATSGRLPLVGPQRRGGWGVSAVCETILAMMRADPRYRAGTDLSAADTPRGIEINVKLDISLPQDKLQQANIVNILTSGDNPKVSNEWALENIFNVNDPTAMRRQIWKERTTEQFYQMVTGQMLQEFAAQLQQQPTPPPGAAGPGPGGPVPGMGGAPGMSAGPAMAPGQAEMIQGGLPPQMAGMVPGQGEGAVPPPPPEELGNVPPRR